MANAQLGKSMSDDFETPETPTVHREVVFMVDLDGYEGPLDVLLTLARDQKLDLTHISILALADQYLSFIAAAQRKNLEIAADYLVMAAWLAYLKSRLLLPDLGGEDEPTGEEMAAALAFQMQRLEAMQNAGLLLTERSQLGREFFQRGAPEIFPSNRLIRGWVEALPLMRVGETWELYIPPDLGYGVRGTPGGPIGPNQALVFQLELVGLPEAENSEAGPADDAG